MPSSLALTDASVAGLDPDLPGGSLADEHLTLLVVGVGQRLNRSATAFYRARWDIGMAEWRLLLMLLAQGEASVSTLAERADIDKALCSRSLATLQDRQLVKVEATRTRGRAAVVRLTESGRTMAMELQTAARQRHEAMFATMSGEERAQLRRLLLALAERADQV